MKAPTKLKVFIQEDDKEMQRKIALDLKDYNYTISFFSKDESAFDLLMFNPDILIQDYQSNKIVKCYEWKIPYNQWT